MTDIAAELSALRQDLEASRAEAENLRSREERLALALCGSGDVLWEWDLAAHQVHFSPGWAGLLGCAPGALGNDPRAWLDQIHPEDRPAFHEAMTAHLEGQTPRLEHEHRLRQPDGTFRWVLARGMAAPRTDRRPPRLLGTLTDITARKRTELELLHRVVHDALTGLPNRGAFLERVERSIARAHRVPGYLFGVLALDIDRFRLINDSLGRLRGDNLLVAVAQRLNICLRPGDLVAHLGGDDFALLVDHMRTPLDATHVARRVQQDLSVPFRLGEQEVFVTASLGIVLSGGGYIRAEDMLRDAEAARSRARAGGYGRHELFDGELNARALARLQLETDLRRALEREEFRLHYQPIVSLATGHITGFEALIRWEHPDRGLLPPAEFLAVAEDTGLSDPISSWVLRAAGAQARVWEGRFGGERPLSMSMNLTCGNFAHPEVIGTVQEVLEETGLEGRHLMLEITESALMKDLDTVVAVLRALKSLEVELHIDDFGTGYSSLSYLHILPTDALKIDRSFVSRMGIAAEDAAIVRTIVDLAHSLDRHVIAEGVETAAQLQRLRMLGCEYGQGFYFSKPLPREGAEALLSARPRW